MKVSLQNLGKKFGREWIFRGVDHEFIVGKPTVILGANGSGKSTLLQVISGGMMAGEGNVKYERDGKKIGIEEIYTHISFASPYLELMEDFTLAESIAFHNKFKSWRNGRRANDILEMSGLGEQRNKQLKNFSSGMKMRTKLLFAILSDTPLLLLDEPCSNLDQCACEWYGKLITENANDRTIIVCSNEVKEEYFFCTEELRMENLKHGKVNG